MQRVSSTVRNSFLINLCQASSPKGFRSPFHSKVFERNTVSGTWNDLQYLKANLRSLKIHEYIFQSFVMKFPLHERQQKRTLGKNFLLQAIKNIPARGTELNLDLIFPCRSST